MAEEITAEALFAQIEAYQAPTSSSSSLAKSESYLFESVSGNGGEIHGNDDYRIEELTDADLECSADIA